MLKKNLREGRKACLQHDSKIGIIVSLPILASSELARGAARLFSDW